MQRCAPLGKNLIRKLRAPSRCLIKSYVCFDYANCICLVEFDIKNDETLLLIHLDENLSNMSKIVTRCSKFHDAVVS